MGSWTLEVLWENKGIIFHHQLLESTLCYLNMSGAQPSFSQWMDPRYRNHVDPWAKWSGSESQWVVRNYLLSLELCSQASICPHRPILKFVSGKILWNTHSHTYLNLDFCSGVISDYEMSEQLSINVSLPSQGRQEERLTINAVLSVATREQDSINVKFLPFSYYNHHFGHAPHFIYFFFILNSLL